MFKRSPQRIGKGILFPSSTCRMRFDKNVPGVGSNVNHSTKLRYKDLPESMKPKQTSADFTPFPLPKFDQDMGFGPFRLRDVPDIEVAKERQQKASLQNRLSNTTFADDQSIDYNLAMSESFKAEDSINLLASHKSNAPTDIVGFRDGDFTSLTDDSKNTVDYEVCRNYPLIDRLECRRSLEDLLHQFVNRPRKEARAASIIDLASTMYSRTDEELIRMFYEISQVFEWDGRGLNFLLCLNQKYGRPFFVSNELMSAYIHLLQTASCVLVEEQPERLQRSPALVIQVLHFLSLVKLFEPNQWFTKNDRAPQNRADYSHARGTNVTIAHKEIGYDLYDYIYLLARGDPGEDSPFLESFSVDQLLDLVAGFAAVMPDGKPPSNVSNAVIDLILRYFSSIGRFTTEKDLRKLEKLYFIMQMIDVKDDGVLSPLLGLSTKSCAAPGGHISSSEAYQLTVAEDLIRGPDFFSAVSRDRRAGVHFAALELFKKSMEDAQKKNDLPSMEALTESGEELLMRCKDKNASIEIALLFSLDTKSLMSIPAMRDVAERLETEKATRETDASQIPLTNFQTQARSVALPETCAIYESNGTVIHRIRTLVAALPLINSLRSVHLLHSSSITTSIEQLVFAVRLMQTGEEVLIVTNFCLRALHHKSLYSRNQKIRDTCLRALEIIAYELEKGRAVLVPFTDQIRIHDNGTYCDEDLFLWTLAAFFARELPLVRVNTLIHPHSTVREPHKYLKGEHSPVSTSYDLYNKNTPLLQALRSKTLRSVTHHVKLRSPVCDRPNRLYSYNPVRARFIYRRDKALFDKYYINSRNNILGFSRGALDHDLRGLGFYTPDHLQVSYSPLPTQH